MIYRQGVARIPMFIWKLFVYVAGKYILRDARISRRENEMKTKFVCIHLSTAFWGNFSNAWKNYYDGNSMLSHVSMKLFASLRNSYWKQFVANLEKQKILLAFLAYTRWH